MRHPILALTALTALAACEPTPDREAMPKATEEPAAETAGSSPDDTATPPPPHVGDPPPPQVPVDPAARRIALAEWTKSENPDTCKPLMLKSDSGAGGKARRAEFSGGWGVAFDLPGRRSAYGIAGTGFVPGDASDAREQRARLAAQWPYFRELEQFPQPSFAGFGVEGAGAYPADNADGNGLNSLAYVRIAGNSCDYNVWSRLGRAHLEVLLDSLAPLPTG